MLVAYAAVGTAYPAESRFGCGDSRTIGISSTSTFMASLAQSADTSMSLVVTGSLSGTIVSGSGALTGNYRAGETLTISTSGSSGYYMLEANVDGFGSCDFATYAPLLFDIRFIQRTR